MDSGAQLDRCLASEGGDDSAEVLFHGDINEEGAYNRPPLSTLLFYPVELKQDVATDINKATEGRAGQVEVPVMHYQHLRGKKKKKILST